MRWALSPLVCVCVLFAADSKSKPQAEGITREQADAILGELKQIRLLLEKVTTPPPGGGPRGSEHLPEAPQAVSKATIPLGTEYVLGSVDAPVTIVEFSDYQCGFCRRFHTQTFSELRKKYIDTGKVRFVSRDLPLDVTSPSMRAAESVRCAGEQGRYWEAREAILAGPPRLTNEGIRALASGVKGLDLTKLDTCVASGKHTGAIQRDIEQAAALNMNGTPSFVIGRSTKDGVDGATLVGALPLGAFEARIEQSAAAPQGAGQ